MTSVPTQKKKKPAAKPVCAAERKPVHDSQQKRLGGAEQTAVTLRDKDGIPIREAIVIGNCRSLPPPWEGVDIENSLTPGERYLCEVQPWPEHAPADVRAGLPFTRVLASEGNCYYKDKEGACLRIPHSKRVWSLCGLCKRECDLIRASNQSGDSDAAWDLCDDLTG